MKTFGGPVLFLDRNDINTDEIIPAKYLTEISKQALKPYLLEDLQLKGFDPKAPELGQAKAVVTRDNFGCGSSREHAVWAFEVNGINLIVGQGFARIFRQNMFNCGMLAVELPREDLDTLFAMGNGAVLTADVASSTLTATAQGKAPVTFAFFLNPFDRELVLAGGWLAYADKKY